MKPYSSYFCADAFPFNDECDAPEHFDLMAATGLEEHFEPLSRAKHFHLSIH